MTKNFVGEPFSVSLISGFEKFLCLRGLCHDFPLKIVCLTVPKDFVEEHFDVSDNFYYEKYYESEEGYHVLPSKNFCLTATKHSEKETFCAVFQKISDGEKLLDKRSGDEKRNIKTFRQKSLSKSTKKFHRGSLLCFKKFQLSKKF